MHFANRTLSSAIFVLMLSAGIARADTISIFDVSGTSGDGNFSGTLQVDVTTGVVENVNITFPGIPTIDVFNSAASQFVILPPVPQFQLAANDGGPVSLIMDFTTTVPDTLDGFAGGIITSGHLTTIGSEISIISGNITPTPVPTSFALFATGMALLALGWARNFRRRTPVVRRGFQPAL
jgi:hypothetical protein